MNNLILERRVTFDCFSFPLNILPFFIMFLSCWCIPDGGLDISATANKLVGTTDAFEDLLQIVGHAFNLDLVGLKRVLQWDILVINRFYKFLKLRKETIHISGRWKASSFSAGLPIPSPPHHQHSAWSGGWNWIWSKQPTMNTFVKSPDLLLALLVRQSPSPEE